MLGVCISVPSDTEYRPVSQEPRASIFDPFHALVNARKQLPVNHDRRKQLLNSYSIHDESDLRHAIQTVYSSVTNKCLNVAQVM